MQCPRCKVAELRFNKAIGKMQCPECGFRLFVDSIEGDAPAKKPSPKASKPQPRTSSKPPPIPIKLPPSMEFSYLLDLSATVRNRVQSLCYSGLAALQRNDREAARDNFERAAAVAVDFPDVWLFLAALAHDREEQRDFLENALIHNPRHAVAYEAMQRLRGGGQQPTRLPTRTTEEVMCPQCGGELDFDEEKQELTCAFCGHQVLAVGAMQRSAQQTTLMGGMLRRKSRPIDWKVGSRRLHCQSCGMSVTVTRETMTNTCRHCNSRQVAVVGLNGHYEQPESILPFRLDEGNARLAVTHTLRSGFRALTRLFADPVQQIVLYAIYLPFWVFDADMQVKWSWSNAPEHGVHPILLSDILFFAADTPDRRLVQQIEPFNMQDDVDYDARLLAEHPAELYDVDVDRASLDVRRELVKVAQRRAAPSITARRPRGRNDDGPGRLIMNASTQFLTYRLALLPVWVGQMVEGNGDRRPLVVNGQSGKVALGRRG